VQRDGQVDEPAPPALDDERIGLVNRASEPISSPAEVEDAAGAASALVATLESVWAAIVGHHPEVPDVVVVVASGSGSKANQLKLGHFAAGRWEVAGRSQPEVLVGGEGLRRGAPDVLATMLHEAAHGLASARGVKDTSRGGRYHNQRYRALATEVGLQVDQDGSRGWSATVLGAAASLRYGQVLADLSAALVLWRRAERSESKAGPSRNPNAYRCCCGRRIRATETTFEEGAIICGRCGEAFTA
jgi:hypothetical protein